MTRPILRHDSRIIRLSARMREPEVIDRVPFRRTNGFWLSVFGATYMASGRSVAPASKMKAAESATKDEWGKRTSILAM